MKRHHKFLVSGLAALFVAACGKDTRSADQSTDALTVSAAGGSVAAPESDSSAGTEARSNTVVALGTQAADAGTGAAAASGGHWGDIVYGDPAAPVTIIEYGSLACSHCASFHASVLPKLKEKYLDTGKAKLIFRNFFLGSRVEFAASVAARCSTEDVAKKVNGMLFGKQNEWLRSQNPMEDLAAVARRVGVSRSAFDRCMADRPNHIALVNIANEGREKYDITGVPTIIVNDVKIDNYALETIERAVEAAL